MLSQSGIPVIYSGDEIGQLNDYSYREDPEKAEDSRYLHRGDFNWELAENRKKPETVQEMCIRDRFHTTVLAVLAASA